MKTAEELKKLTVDQLLNYNYVADYSYREIFNSYYEFSSFDCEFNGFELLLMYGETKYLYELSEKQDIAHYFINSKERNLINRYNLIKHYFYLNREFSVDEVDYAVLLFGKIYKQRLIFTVYFDESMEDAIYFLLSKKYEDHRFKLLSFLSNPVYTNEEIEHIAKEQLFRTQGQYNAIDRVIKCFAKT